MAAKDNMSKQFNFIHKKLATHPQYGTTEHTLAMHDFDGEKALVTYRHYTDPGYDRPSRIEVDYLESHEEGKGHGRRLMQHMYDRYPKSFIDWGLTVHPAATLMAQDFEEKYYDRTAYEPADYDEWDVND